MCSGELDWRGTARKTERERQRKGGEGARPGFERERRQEGGDEPAPLGPGLQLVEFGRFGS